MCALNCKEKLIFGVILFALVFPKAGTKFGGIPVTVGSLSLAAVFLLWLFAEEPGPQEKIRSVPVVHAVFLAYISLLALGIVLFKLQGPAAHRLAVVVPIMVPLIVYYMAFPATAAWFSGRDRLEKVLMLFALANLALGIYGLMQHFIGHYRVMIPGLTVSWADARIPDVYSSKCNLMPDGSLKVTSTFQNGNIYGVYLAMTVPILAAGLISARTKATGALFGLACLVSLANVPVTLARSAFFGVSVGLFVLFLMRKPLRDKVVVSALYLYMAAIILTNSRLFKRLVLSFFDPSLGNRREGIKTLSMSAEGWPDFLFGALCKKGVFYLDSYMQRASENIYVTFFWWFGFVGMFLFGAACLLVMFRPFRRMLKTRADYDTFSVLAQALLAGLLAYLIMAVIEGAMFMPPTGMNLWFLLGLLAAANYRSEREVAG